MIKNNIFYYRNNRHIIYDVINKKYNKEDIIILKAYRFAAELLLLPIRLNCNIIVYNNARTVVSDCMCGEDIETEKKYILEKFPDMNNLCNEIITAREIGLLQRWVGGHASVNLEILFRDGYQCRIEKVKELLAKTDDTTKVNFYKAELIVLIAVQKQIIRYKDAAIKIVTNTYDDKLKNNLLRFINTCENIAYNPPNDFYEAVQLIAFTHEFCSVEGYGTASWGIRIDKLLNKYYINDVKNKKIDKQYAIDIICSLWEMYNSYGERCANLTLGGMDELGNDMSNEMTLICMEASIKVKANVPLLTLRVHPKLNKKVWDKALQLVISGQGFPAFYNDKVAIEAKRNAGISKEDAYDYSTLGCVELTIAGREYTETEGARINWLKILELMLFDGKCLLTGKMWHLKEKHNLDEFNSFEQFYNWYKIELKDIITKVAGYADKALDINAKYWPMPYLSSITYGCIENGSDITAHGTKYYNLAINCVGMANTVNSLEVIEQLVFKDKSVSFEQLKEAIKANYVGYEALQKKILKCPKYGNDINSVDKKMTDLMNLFSETVYAQKISGNRGKFQCGFYSVMHHALLGMKTGASCDGRYACTSLANSLSPVQGTDINGPTAVINSINKISMKYMGNGGVLDMKFMPSFFEKENHVQALKYLIETYFENGGLEVQFNVVDSQNLKEAQKNPKKYQNLVVRVSGYSAYFVQLEKELQDEIINRTSNGGKGKL